MRKRIRHVMTFKEKGKRFEEKQEESDFKRVL